MTKLETFIKYINDRTCNKYPFLRVKQVLFDRQKNECVLSIIYPFDKDLTNDDKQKITNVVNDYVTLKQAKVIVNISKSFIEPDLIRHKISMFFKKNSALLFNTMGGQDVNILIDKVNITINLSLEKANKSLFFKTGLDRELKEYLENQFCANVLIIVSEKQATEINDKSLQNRLASIERQSELDSLVVGNLDKYLVSDKRVIVGDEIHFNPRVISSIKKEYENTVIAGKIFFLTERTYKSKRKVKTKDGEEKELEKPLFRFQIKDNTGAINAIIFPSKVNYHKMHLLKNGDTILVQGKVEKYNDNYEIVVKNISLCTIPDKNEVEKIVNEELITDYKFVRPQKYYSQKQTNLFEIERHLSKEVRQGSFVVYDFETTGVNVTQDEIIEIGALKIENGEYKEVFTTLVKPKRPIPAEATKVNKITDEMVSNCCSIEQVIRDFYLFCKGSQMVGYNSIAFDSIFLLRAGKSIGLDFNNNQLDAFLLAKEKLKGLRNYKLGTVAKYLEVNLVDAHRALNDVIATAEVFLKLY